MIRLFLFTLIRLFLSVLAIYFVLMLVKGFLRGLQGRSRQSSHFPQSQAPPKPKEDYQDVREARFTELEGKERNNGENSHQ
jgi:hypothetical protein